MKLSEKIGFLPYPRTLEFKGGCLTPLAHYREASEAVQKAQNRDGFVYPPRAVTHTGSPMPGKQNQSEKDWEWKLVPNTERPALLHKLPASHELVIHQSPVGDDFRTSDGAFLMHLTGYIFGVRLQFSDWWHDGRIPVKTTHGVHVTSARLSDFFTHSYREWRALDEPSRKSMTNILYMNSRSPTYEWDWERFAVNYMVFDALFKFATMVRKLRNEVSGKRRSHRNRLDAMCRRFRVRQRKAHLDRIHSLRNDLFHEALWDGGHPCFSMGAKAFAEVENLRRLNQRLVPAVLGFRTPYIRTAWWTLSTFSL